MKKVSKNVNTLQMLQNTMIRVIMGLDKKKHINMQHLREEIKMMSINQMSIYHTLLEAYNVIRNSSSEQIKLKWAKKNEIKYFLRSESRFDQMIPEKPMTKCVGFSYNGSKLFNMLPSKIKDTTDPKIFKSQIKTWIWKNIPAYWPTTVYIFFWLVYSNFNFNYIIIAVRILC